MNNYRLTHSVSELSGFTCTCTSSLTMNKKFQYCTRPLSVVLKISSSLLVNECRWFPIIHEQWVRWHFYYSNWIQCKKNRQTLSQPKPWCNDSGVLNLHHDNDVMNFVSSQPSVTHWYQSTNQKITIHTVYEIWIINVNIQLWIVRANTTWIPACLGTIDSSSSQFCLLWATDLNTNSNWFTLLLI